MQLFFGGFITAVGFIVDGATFVTPPVHISGKNYTANLRCHTSTGGANAALSRGSFRVGFRNRADQFVPRNRKDLSCGIQFNLTESVTLAIGYCKAMVLCQIRKSRVDRCRLLSGSYFVGEKGKVTLELFLVFEDSGKRHTADTDGPDIVSARRG
jgi:hypothetical protein